MASGGTQSGEIARSFIEDARGAQIVQGALEVIAERGHPQTTMGRIAQRAAISRSLVSCRFAGRADLIGRLITEVFGRGAEHPVPRVEAAQSPRESNVIDGVSTRLAVDPDSDLVLVTTEIVTVLHRATRALGEERS